MNVKPIKTKKEYQQALARLELIFDAKNGTKEGIRVPIDDRAGLSLKDRAFALGSQDILWEKGSVNRAVKENAGSQLGLKIKLNVAKSLL